MILQILICHEIGGKFSSFLGRSKITKKFNTYEFAGMGTIGNWWRTGTNLRHCRGSMGPRVLSDEQKKINFEQQLWLGLSVLAHMPQESRYTMSMLLV
jgi:hypothetical protein